MYLLRRARTWAPKILDTCGITSSLPTLWIQSLWISHAGSWSWCKTFRSSPANKSFRPKPQSIRKTPGNRCNLGHSFPEPLLSWLKIHRKVHACKCTTLYLPLWQDALRFSLILHYITLLHTLFSYFHFLTYGRFSHHPCSLPQKSQATCRVLSHQQNRDELGRPAAFRCGHRSKSDRKPLQY